MSIERQELREITQLSDGLTRYKDQIDKQGAGETSPGLGLVYVAMDVMIPALTETVRLLEAGSTHPSQVPLAVQYMTQLRPDAVAYIAAKVCVSSSANRGKITRTAMRIANLLSEDYQFEELEQAEPALCNSMSRKARKWTTSVARRKIMRKAALIAGVAPFGWTEQEKLKLGVYLIEQYVKLTGFAELIDVREGKQTHKLLDMTAPAAERLADRRDQIGNENPLDVPMISPPKPWTTPTSGGYLTPRMQTDLVRGVNPQTRDEVFSCDMDQVYEAVNRLQATRWRVNRAVYDVLSVCSERGDTIAGLPEDVGEAKLKIAKRPSNIPGDLAPEDMDAGMREAFDIWKTKAREGHEYASALASKTVSLNNQLTQAKGVIDEDAIYFPHSLDFRGRVYPMATGMSPQADDIGKSLIEFADGKPLGETGGYWLAVHIANLFGEDKVSFDERVEWTVKHSKHIMDSAMNPLDGARFWSTAEDPWCALAACFEWTGFQIEGDDYVSHTPIAMDGSCSGIQHFSAMLRDAEGGRAVNLTPSDAPHDIYTEVLNKAKDLLAENCEPLAKVWMDVLDRGMVKRPCMTFAYSVTSIGIREQIVSEMRKQSDGQYLPGHENWQAAAFLAPIVEDAIRQVVDRAAEAMDWLKGMAKQYTSEEIPTSWVTPLGFPVVQPYRKAQGKRMTVWFDGIRLQLTLKIESRKIDGRKQSSSVAPNFVHSLDATHLMMVSNTLGDSGVTESFAMIHDSFGVHACDVTTMHYVIRDEFIKLYDEDILKKAYQSTLLALPGSKWPDVELPPESGDLDLEGVRDADFFFA